MKTPELLLASAVIAVVAGVGTALATRAFQDAPARTELEARAASPAPDAAASTALPTDAQRALDELRLDNAALRERLFALEARLGELASTRTPLAVESQAAAGLEPATAAAASMAPEFAVDDDFVASVGRALDEIEAKEEAARELRRKEQQALRIEERVTRLQQELGLTNRQASDVRTALIGADDKREALFASMREGEGDPRDLREGFRTLRDETYTALQGVLSPEQFESFKQRDESDFGRRDFGGGPPGTPEARPERQGRRQREDGQREGG